MKPIDMILFCPVCHAQHIDAPEPEPECDCFIPILEGDGQHAPNCKVFKERWANPPHKSHLCHRCGTIWRPADVPTNGVESIATRGELDTWLRPERGSERRS